MFSRQNVCELGNRLESLIDRCQNKPFEQYCRLTVLLEWLVLVLGCVRSLLDAIPSGSCTPVRKKGNERRDEKGERKHENIVI